VISTIFLSNSSIGFERSGWWISTLGRRPVRIGASVSGH
jgi:hypothetical protein